MCDTDLTNATEFEIESATQSSIFGSEDITDETAVNRWAKKGDRLYINAPIAKLEKHKVHIDLEAGELRSGNESAFVGHVDVDGDTLTITIVDKTGLDDHEHEIVISTDLPVDDVNGKEEVVTDGGEDVTDYVDDETIEAAINDHDDPDHPHATTVERVRELLAVLAEATQAGWTEYLDGISHGDSLVVAEDHGVVIIDTGEWQMYDQEIDALDHVEYRDEVERDVLNAVIHEVARQRTPGYDWGYSYPMVLVKPDDAEAGQRYVDTVINNLLDRGLSPAEAWYYYGVRIRGNGQSQWARACGKDQSTVAKAINRATQKALELR